MDIINFWNENTEKNILKTWLCGGTEGQTYPIHDHIFRIDLEGILKKGFKFDFCCIEDAFNKVLGFKHDYKIDDANLDSVADSIHKELHKLSIDINVHPEKYFNRDESQRIKDELGVDRNELARRLSRLSINSSPICSSFMTMIANKVIDEVAEDMIERADGSGCFDDDLRFAFSRVLCKRLGIVL